MLRNYLKIAFRSLARNRVNTLINVAGLTLGITCCLLITAYVLDELSYDRFHQNADRIVLLQQFEGAPTSGGRLATDFKQRFAQVQNTVRLLRTQPLLGSRTTAAYEENFVFADSSAFSVFTLPLALGNPETALSEHYGVVLTERMAQKYFPNQNPLGNLLRYDNKHTLHVTGVLRNLPSHSHQQIDFLANYADANEILHYDVTTNLWGGSAWTYLLLAPGQSASATTALSAQFPTYLKQLGDPNVSIWKLRLVPLADIYLNTDLIAPNRQTYVVIFSVVALLILLLAGFNYVNLATAQATSRAREVGVRKVLGSSFGQLWRQFLGETTLFVGLSVGLTCLLVPMVLPAFSSLTDKTLQLADLITLPRLAGLGVGLLTLCLLAGSYPAFVLARFRPVAALKGAYQTAGQRPKLRQLLVVGQFTVSMIMIVATLVIFNQLNYVQRKNLGYSRDQVLVLNFHDATETAKRQFKEQVQTLSGVRGASQSFSVPGSGMLIGDKLVSDYAPRGATDLNISRLTIDDHFLKTFDIRLVQGRNLDHNRPIDQRSFLINEAAMRYFGWTNISGKMLGYYTFEYDATGNYREVPQRGPVVGVVADYHQKNLKNTIEPLLFSLGSGAEGFLSVKLQAGTIPATVKSVEALWQRSFPNTPFDYEFMDDFFTRSYRADSRSGQVIGLFAALAVLISCLGLFGLASFTAEKRTKEIGVRKVLGASVYSIVALLSRDFVKLVLIAVVIASPLAWWAMNAWLNDFAYKVDVAWWVFVLAGTLSIMIALLTVSFQAIKAALMNPIKALRTE